MLLNFFTFSLFLSILSSPAFAQTAENIEAQNVVPNDNPVSSEVNYDLTHITVDSLGYDLIQHNGDKAIWGFSFVNTGVDSIIPTETGEGGSPEREFDFEFDGRSRQDIQMIITDTPDDLLSNLMASYIYFFPRKNLPAIQWPVAGASDQSKFTVILPTGESVVFDTKSKTIISGVLSETRGIDLNPSRFARKFAGINYSGTGVMIRVDKRGTDPRFNNTATITQGTKKCTLPASLLFNQDENSNAEFLFPTDEGINALLLAKCKISFL